jgi:hypothetical protein
MWDVLMLFRLKIRDNSFPVQTLNKSLSERKVVLPCKNECPDYKRQVSWNESSYTTDTAG